MPDDQTVTERVKRSVAILAYGSVIDNPGSEIQAATVDIRKGITTPFAVEFARTSKERRGAPTLVLVQDHGAPVLASLIVVNVEEAEAADRLYRREINAVGSGKRYKP